eukprot:1857754-Pleurochrysis_carterae.AAC.2
MGSSSSELKEIHLPATACKRLISIILHGGLKTRYAAQTLHGEKSGACAHSTPPTCDRRARCCLRSKHEQPSCEGARAPGSRDCLLERTGECTRLRHMIGTCIMADICANTGTFAMGKLRTRSRQKYARTGSISAAQEIECECVPFLM